MFGTILMQRIVSAALCAATLVGLPGWEGLYFQGAGANMVEDFGAEAGKSMYGDTKRIIQDCSEAVVRARNAMQDSENIVRIGTSPMTPGQFVLKLWPAIQEQCPGNDAFPRHSLRPFFINEQRSK